MLKKKKWNFGWSNFWIPRIFYQGKNPETWMESSMFKGKSRMEINGFEDLQGLPQIPDIFSRAPFDARWCQGLRPGSVARFNHRVMLSKLPKAYGKIYKPLRTPMPPTVNAQRLTSLALDARCQLMAPMPATWQLGCASQSVKCWHWYPNRKCGLSHLELCELSINIV